MKTYQVLVEFSTAAYVTIEAENESEVLDMLDNPNFDLSPDHLDMDFCHLGHNRSIGSIEIIE